MKELRSVCWLCRGARSRLGASATGRLSRTSPSFTTTAWRNEEPGEGRNGLEKEEREYLHVAPRYRTIGTSPASTPTPSSRRSPQLPRRRKSEDGSHALEMFRRVVHKQKDSNDEPKPIASSTSIELYQNLAKLDDMLQQSDIPDKACYDFFETTIYRPYSDPMTRTPKILGGRATKLVLSRVLHSKAADFESKDLPSLAQIMQIQSRLGLLSPKPWASLMLNLLNHICTITTSPSDYSSIEQFDESMARREMLLQELLGAWKVFSQPRFARVQSATGSDQLPDFHFPSLERRTLKHGWQQQRHLLFASLFPAYNPQELGDVAAAAIATFILLMDPINQSSRALKADATAFTNAVSRALALMPLRSEELEAMYSDYTELHSYARARWPSMDEYERSTAAKTRPELIRRLPGASPTSSLRPEAIHRKLSQAFKKLDVGAVDLVWKEFWGGEATPDAERKQRLQDGGELFDFFIMAYMALRHPKKSIHAWNCMRSVGVQPTLRTWTSMMEGCKRSHNPNGIKDVWQKLIESKTQLDVPAWTARISGLIDGGDPKAGLEALTEMMQLWKQDANTGSNPAAVQPTIEPVNAALAGLVRRNAFSAAMKVLAWAEQQGIGPDVYTYNTLLRPMIRGGHTDEVTKIFDMMKQGGVQADEATFTILLDGALERLGDQSTEAQLEIVTNIIAQMEAGGIDANMRTYGKMLYLLFQEGSATEETVKAVLAHIWGKGLELSSHIYTMLAEYYFSRDPPDSKAVDALIENRRLQDNKNIDRVFWERVIEGYCQVGETSKALAIFERIHSSGSIVTALTLFELLSALVDSGQREAASRLVSMATRSAEHSDGRITENPQARAWRHRFWHLAERNGLLDEASLRYRRGSAA